jgi:hypothetical protein
MAAGLGAMEVCSSTEMGAPVPRIWERETTDPKPTEADHDQSSLTPQGLGIPLRAFRCGKPPERIVAISDT